MSSGPLVFVRRDASGAKYHVQKLISNSGTFGDVYKVTREPPVGGSVAVLKVYRNNQVFGHLIDWEFEQRGLRDMQEAFGDDWPSCLVRILGTMFDVESRVAEQIICRKAIEMEWISAPTLKQSRDEGRFSGDMTSMRVARSLIEAISVLHQRKVWHRDLHPENVHVEIRGLAIQVKIGDYSASTRVRDSGGPTHHSTRPAIGALGYWDPDPRWGESELPADAGKFMDLYSLGSLLCFIFTGASIEDAGRNRTRLADKGVPPRLIPLVLGLTSMCHEDRVQSITEVQEQFDCASYGGSPHVGGALTKFGSRPKGTQGACPHCLSKMTLPEPSEIRRLLAAGKNPKCPTCKKLIGLNSDLTRVAIPRIVPLADSGRRATWPPQFAVLALVTMAMLAWAPWRSRTPSGERLPMKPLWNSTPPPNTAGDGADGAPLTPLLHSLALCADPSEGGEVQSLSGGAKFEAGTEVLLLAAQQPGWTFAGWADADASGARRTWIVRRDVNAVTARFRRLRYRVTARAEPQGSGACDPAEHEAEYDAVLKFTSEAARGWRFMGWADDPAAGVCREVRVREDLQLVARFAAEHYMVAARAEPKEGGRAKPAEQEVAYGSVATVIAEPNPGWRFSNWSDGYAGVARREVRVEKALGLVARFEAERYVVTARAEPKSAGRVTPSEQEVAHGSLVTVIAVGNPGWRFSGWSDGSVAGARRELRVKKALDLVARFEAENYIVTARAEPKEGGQATPPEQKAAYDEVVTVQAQPTSGWRFAGWADDSGAGPRRDVRVAGALVLVAVFEAERYVVTARAEPKNGGSVTPAEQEVAHDSLVTVMAEAANGWRFSGWADGWASGARRLQRVQEDLGVVALFELEPAVIVLEADPKNGGKITALPAKSKYTYGETLTLVAEAAEGWEFVGWEGGAADREWRVQFYGAQIKGPTCAQIEGPTRVQPSPAVLSFQVVRGEGGGGASWESWHRPGWCDVGGRGGRAVSRVGWCAQEMLRGPFLLPVGPVLSLGREHVVPVVEPRPQPCCCGVQFGHRPRHGLSGGVGIVAAVDLMAVADERGEPSGIRPGAGGRDAHPIGVKGETADRIDRGFAQHYGRGRAQCRGRKVAQVLPGTVGHAPPSTRRRPPEFRADRPFFFSKQEKDGVGPGVGVDGARFDERLDQRGEESALVDEVSPHARELAAIWGRQSQRWLGVSQGGFAGNRERKSIPEPVDRGLEVQAVQVHR